MRAKNSKTLRMVLLLIIIQLAAPSVSAPAQSPPNDSVHSFADASMLRSVSQAVLSGEAYIEEAKSLPALLVSTPYQQEQEVDLKLLEAQLNAVKAERRELDTLCRYGREKYKDDACKLEQWNSVCDRMRAQLNGLEAELRKILPDRRKGITKLAAGLKRLGRRIWHGIGPIARNILRSLTSDVQGMVLANQEVTVKVIKVLLRQHVRRALETAAFEQLTGKTNPAALRGSACDDQTGKKEAAAEEAVGEALTQKFTVRSYRGNAENFSTPPTIYFANTADYPSPAGGVITYAGEEAHSYLAWMLLPIQSSWIQMETTEPVTAIGVQLFGDYDDGMVRVLVDGTSIWRGYTRYENCDFDDQGNRIITVDTCHGGYIYYIEASGMDSGLHTIRVQNEGNGETTVYFFGSGKVRR